MEKNLDTTKPSFREHILPVLWPYGFLNRGSSVVRSRQGNKFQAVHCDYANHNQNLPILTYQFNSSLFSPIGQHHTITMQL